MTISFIFDLLYYFPYILIKRISTVYTPCLQEYLLFVRMRVRHRTDLLNETSLHTLPVYREVPKMLCKSFVRLFLQGEVFLHLRPPVFLLYRALQELELRNWGILPGFLPNL